MINVNCIQSKALSCPRERIGVQCNKSMQIFAKRGGYMQRIVIIGEQKLAFNIAKQLLTSHSIEIVYIIGKTFAEPFADFIQNNQIKTKHYFELDKNDDIDVVIDTTDEPYIKKLMKEYKSKQPLYIGREVVNLVFSFLQEQQKQIEDLRLILNNIQDGLIVIDREGYVRIINQTATNFIEVGDDAIGKHINDVIPNSRLPHILQTRQKEVNKKFKINGNREIVTTRIPLIDSKNRLVGAFAIFKDTHEVVHLAEENTDLKQIKTMLEAIIHSSEDAINVVDEEGKALIINPAYTRITGLTEEDVIGKPATVDISEGESIHMQVLKSRRPIRGARLKVGPMKKEVIVNVAPVIVQGKLKGSVAVIHDISEIQQLTSELKRAKQMIRDLEATYTFDDIIGQSEEIKIAIDQAKIAAKTPATVLLRGASGTGKELFAHAIHNASDRKHNKFIRVNCAALSESVLESELFGYEGGAFTGAKKQGKKGLFEEANQGSIFLDEIGELSLTTQAKLLRVLQEKEIVRVGGTRPIPVDVRIIAATNANLEKKIRENTFREDLYYRLNRLPIYIPSLKERMDDLPHLVQFLINKVNQLYGRTVKSISDLALQKLRQYDWPGNVRELENVISRAIIFMDIAEQIIEHHHIEPLQKEDRTEVDSMITNESTMLPLKDTLERFEKEFIKHVYEKNNFNKTKTAESLQISVRNLYYKLEKYNLH